MGFTVNAKLRFHIPAAYKSIWLKLIYKRAVLKTFKKFLWKHPQRRQPDLLENDSTAGVSLYVSEISRIVTICQKVRKSSKIGEDKKALICVFV